MAGAEETADPPDGRDGGQGLTVLDPLRMNLHRRVIRFSRLWAEIHSLGQWLEHDALPAAKEAGDETARLALVDADDGVQLKLCLREADPTHYHGDRLAGFLHGIGVTELTLDVRLESNQITDILCLLHLRRRALEATGKKGSQNGTVGRLRSPSGLNVSCARVRLQDSVLRIDYAYCMTRFSRLVALFERSHRHFGDHRALFHAAPRYAAAATLCVLIPLALYVLHDSWWLLLIVTLIGAAGLFAMVFLLLMTVGSVEYDNEEKAHRLEIAYGHLQRYSDRIRRELRHARTIQDNLLPDIARMPLSEDLQWASSFVPMTEVAGDYFDAAELENRLLALLFADVSGHGMSAALVTAILKTAFEGWKESPVSLDRFAQHLNRLLCRVTPDESFAAVVLATYDPASRELCHVNCGHCPFPLLIPGDSDGEVCWLEEANTMVLGVQEENEFPTACRTLRPGDSLLLATDGVTEAVDDEDEQFGADRLIGYARAQRDRLPEQLVEGLVRHVEDFTGQGRQGDDRTVLAFRAT